MNDPLDECAQSLDPSAADRTQASACVAAVVAAVLASNIHAPKALSNFPLSLTSIRVRALHLSYTTTQVPIEPASVMASVARKPEPFVLHASTIARIHTYLAFAAFLSALFVGCALHYKKIVKNGVDRKSTRLNSSHSGESRMPSSA